MTGPRALLHVAPSFALGGRETRTVALMQRMPRPIRHFVLALDGATDSLERLDSDVDVELVSCPHPPGAGFPSRVRAMRRLLRELPHDLLLTYNWGAIEWLLAARLAGRRAVVHHEDGFGPEEVDTQLRRRVWLRRRLLPVCHAVVVPSRKLQELALGDWRQPASRVRLLPNGVDLARFRPRGDGGDGGLVFGCVGRFRPEKNQALAVACFASLPEPGATRLRLVGDGQDLDAVRQLADRLGVADRVDFIGAVQDTSPEYRDMDVFLIPSRTEQMPISLLEAMASGLPIVGTDVGDVREMVSEANRELIVPAGDEDALGAAMARLARDPGLRRELGQANRRVVEQRYEIGKCYDAYLDVYRQAVETTS